MYAWIHITPENYFNFLHFPQPLLSSHPQSFQEFLSTTIKAVASTSLRRQKVRITYLPLKINENNGDSGGFRCPCTSSSISPRMDFCRKQHFPTYSCGSTRQVGGYGSWMLCLICNCSFVCRCAVSLTQYQLWTWSLLTFQRIYARCFIVGTFGFDDFFLILATVSHTSNPGDSFVILTWFLIVDVTGNHCLCAGHVQLRNR